MTNGASTMAEAKTNDEVEVRAKITKTNAVVNKETPKRSSRRNFEAVGWWTTDCSGFFCFGMRRKPTKEIGTATNVANQNTHGQDTNWTRIAPMRRPITIEDTFVSCVLYYFTVRVSYRSRWHRCHQMPQ